MTHDEIAQLDAAGLRLEVARVKGFIDNREFCENEFLGPDNEWYYLESEYEADRIVPNWPADIAAAWELVEEMRAAGQLVIIKLWPEPAEFFSIEILWKRDKDGYVQTKGDTAPLAICRAWLMWKQG